MQESRKKPIVLPPDQESKGQGTDRGLRHEAAAECLLEQRELLDFLADVIETGADQVRKVDRLCQGYRITERARSLIMPDKLRAVALYVKLCGWERPQPKEEPGKVTKVVIGGNGR